MNLISLLRRLLTCFGVIVALIMLVIVGIKSYSAIAGALPGASNIAASSWQIVPREVASETLSLYPITTGGESSTFDGHLAYEHVLAQVEIGPRPTDSEAGFIHTLTIAVGVLGLTIWGLARVAKPIASELSGSTSGYISSLVFDGVIVMVGSSVLRIVANILSV